MGKKEFKDIAKVVLGNVISLLSSVLVAFIIPKITSVTSFGYYKTFTLYISYIGLLHFGFCDGVYLKYGGRKFESLNPLQFRLYFIFLTLLEFFVSIVIGMVTLFFIPHDLKKIFYYIAVYSFAHIYSSYYQLVSQAIGRFKEFSLRIIIYSVLRIFGVSLFFIYTNITGIYISHDIYILFTILLEISMAIWYVYTYRNISFGERCSYKKTKKELFGFFKLGFPLLITNLSSTFLLTLDRQFVNILFSKEIYAVYAFAYSLLSLVTTATSAIATVLFPKLKQLSVNKLKDYYSSLVSAVLVTVYTCMMAYFPLNWFINRFLSSYVDSLIIFRIIFPGLAISSVITIVMFNYYKVIGIVEKYFKMCFNIIIISGVANYFAYVLYKNTISISIASIITMIIWYLVSERYFIRTYKVEWISNFIYMIIMLIGFYFVSYIHNNFIGLLLYLLFYLVMFWIFPRKNILKLLLIKNVENTDN